MPLQVFRFEGPPSSGKTTAALSQLYQMGLRVPSDPGAGNEDVSIVEASALIGASAPGAEVSVSPGYLGLEESKDSIAQSIMEIAQGIGAKACVIERTREVFTIAGADAAKLLEYVRYMAEQEGIQYLVFEDVEPAMSEQASREAYESLVWLKDAPYKVMPTATPLNCAPIMARVAWDGVSSRVVFPFSMSREACDASGWRLGPMCNIVQGAARFRLAALEDPTASPTVNKEDIRVALRDMLVMSHGEHSAIMRSRFARSQFAEPLCKAIATYAYDGGVLPTGETVKQFMAEQLKASGLGDGAKPSNGAVWKAVKALLDDRILWIGADGKAQVRDPLLGVRLLRPDLHKEVDALMRRDRFTRASQAASRSV